MDERAVEKNSGQAGKLRHEYRLPHTRLVHPSAGLAVDPCGLTSTTPRALVLLPSSLPFDRQTRSCSQAKGDEDGLADSERLSPKAGSDT